MAQIPTAARKKRYRDEDDDGDNEIDEEIEDRKKKMRKPRVSLSSKLLATVEPFPPGFLPRSDDEKREVYLRIIRLRSIGKTYQQCADTLGLAEKTIRNYTKEPLYEELETALQADARQQGYHLISEMILDSYETLYELMRYSASDFVRYKAAAEILMHGGFGVPRDEAQTNNREEATKFLDEVRKREKQPGIAVNVQINMEQPQGGMPTNSVVEGSTALALGEHVQDPLVQESVPAYAPVLPGGKIPGGWQV